MGFLYRNKIDLNITLYVAACRVKTPERAQSVLRSRTKWNWQGEKNIPNTSAA